MKYSIRGNLNIADGAGVISVINKYSLWRLVTAQEKDENGYDMFTFEVWISTELEKTNLFNELKAFVDQYGEVIDWHVCTHDETAPQPCVIAETYSR